MPSSYTTADLLESIKTRGMVATSANSWSDARILNVATEELLVKLMPLIVSAREEYYVTRYQTPVVVSQEAYSIPARASGIILRDVQLIQGTSIRSLPQIDSNNVTTSVAGSTLGYYFESGNVILYPPPNQTGFTLQLRYMIRPSRLEQTINCGQIVSISAGTNQITVSAIPAAWGSGTVVDLISAVTPYGAWATEQTITNVSGTTITFASLPASLAVNDWVALAEFTPIPQAPFEFMALLSQMVVVKILETQGPAERLASAKADMQSDMKLMLDLITPRNQGENQKLVSRWGRRNSPGGRLF